MKNENIAIRSTYLNILGHLILVAIKWLAGVFGNSYALIADAIESSTDVFSSLLVLLGLKYAKRPADENHPYGHGKIEPVITFTVVILLVLSAIAIAYQSIQNIKSPDELPKSWTLIVLACIILWKEISFRYMRKKSRESNSASLAADAWHHRSDAISSVAAFIGISIALLFGKGFESADDWAALIAAAFILYNAYKIFRPALAEMMDEQLHEELVEEIRAVALKVEGVKGTEKCFIRKAGTRYHVDLHASVDAEISVLKGHEIAHTLKDQLLQEIENLGEILIHIEPHEDHNKNN